MGCCSVGWRRIIGFALPLLENPLTIPELRQIVISFLDKASLVSFCLTCKDFFDHKFVGEYWGRRLIQICLNSGYLGLVKWALEALNAPISPRLHEVCTMTTNENPKNSFDIIVYLLDDYYGPRKYFDDDESSLALHILLERLGEFCSQETLPRLFQFMDEHHLRDSKIRRAIDQGIVKCGDVEILKKFMALPGFEPTPLLHIARRSDQVEALFLLEGWTTPELVQENIWLLICHLPSCTKGTKCLLSAIEATKKDPTLTTPVTSRNEYLGCFEIYGMHGFVEGIEILLKNKQLLFGAKSNSDMIPCLRTAMRGGSFPPTFPNPNIARLVFDFLTEETQGYPHLILEATTLLADLKEFQEKMTSTEENARVVDSLKVFLEPYFRQRKETGTTVYSEIEMSTIAFALYLTGLTDFYPFLERYAYPFNSLMYQRLLELWRTHPCMSNYSAFRHVRLAHWLKDHGFNQVINSWREIVPQYHANVIREMLYNLTKQGEGDELWLLEDLFGPELLQDWITDSVIFRNLEFTSLKPPDVKFSDCMRTLVKCLEIYGRKGSPFQMNPHEMNELLMKSTLPKSLKKDFASLFSSMNTSSLV